MIQLLSENEILLLFSVITIGYLIGQLKIGKSKLGVVAVLFTGLFFGAMNKNFQLSEIIFQIGLIIFVYTIGLSSGPAFFNSYIKNGFKDFIFIAATVICTGLIAAGFSLLFGFSPASIAGIFAGSSTNTPALASVIDIINNLFEAEVGAKITQEAVVAYSYAYVSGILGVIFAVILSEKIFKIDYEKEKFELRKEYPSENRLTSYVVEITNKEIVGKDIRSIRRLENLNIIFGRLKNDDITDTELIDYNTKLKLNDLVSIIGNEEDLKGAVEFLGIRKDKLYLNDRNKYDVRRIFVSNPSIIGRTIGELNLKQNFDATITRIRRGDLEILAKDDVSLELGDRIRFVALRKDLKTLSKYFGDSYQSSASVNLFSFGLGIVLGLLLGSIQFSLGSTLNFQLGLAGGPLIISLILGALKRTGPIVWTLPYSATITLQQIGLVLLLTVIGVRSGNSFVDSLSIEGFMFMLVGLIIAFSAAFLMLFIGYKLLKYPFSILIGMVSNQPALLDFAVSRSKAKIPTFGYATMFPIALIMKLLVAQILYLLLIG